MKEIIQNKNKIVTFNKTIVSKLKKLADKSKNKRSRVIIHLDRNSKVNEMIICLKKNSYIQPHIHPISKTESYHIIEGEMNVFIFNQKGKILKIVKMGVHKKGYIFYYRMNIGIFHMPVATSRYCVYHEVFAGPFKKRRDVKYSKWSPNQNEKINVRKFLKKFRTLELNNVIK